MHLNLKYDHTRLPVKSAERTRNYPNKDSYFNSGTSAKSLKLDAIKLA